MSKKTFELDFRGRKLIVESGEYAKQAHGSVLVRYGDTVVLTAAVMSNNVSTADFFPLTVVYNETVNKVNTEHPETKSVPKIAKRLAK